ncbi:MAG: hypothetical protein IPP72_00365 [Chitinophagaceae bacterium]|nr:hypothetical protein [Chitinophagaceae bacterium]
MRDQSNKYFYLMALLMGSVLAVVGIIVLAFYILKLFAITLFNIPGSSYLFELFIVIIPYLILFAAYYLVHTQVSASRRSAAAGVARILLTTGSLICVTGLVLSLVIFFKVKAQWLTIFNEYANHTFALHLILILISAGILATGDPKEKSWLERQ